MVCVLGGNREEMINIYKQLNSYKKQLEEKGYCVVYIGLYGSQNYNLDDEHSDIDARAVVLPSIMQLLQSGNISKTYDFDTGQVDVKDVMTFVTVLRKGNPAYIESANTDVWIGDKMFREMIQGWNVNPKAIVGMMYEKKKALEKGLAHNAPTMEKLGYDSKQIHHIYRLYNMLLGTNVYHNEDRDKMLNIKRNGDGALEEVLTKANHYIEDANEIIKNKEFKPTPVKQNIYNYMETKMMEQLFKPNDTLSCRQYRTFNGNVPKKHKELFPQLEEKDGTDFTYVIWSYLEEM